MNRQVTMRRARRNASMERRPSSFWNSSFPDVFNAYTHSLPSRIRFITFTYISIYVYIFSISFLSNAVPPINPKILSFIILCHRGGGWMENIERDPTINSIRSQSKNDPIGFQWQFGKSFKFLFERYFNEVNEIVFPTIQREVSLKKIDRVINPDRASSLRSRFRIPKNDIPQSCSPKLISQVFEEIFRETRVSRESSYVNSTRSRISSRASPTRKRQSSQRSKFHRYKFMGLNINEAEG